jgi:hypothetical protein
MARQIHMQLDVAGALRNGGTSLDGLQDTAQGRTLDREEARLALIDMLADGVKYIPVGDCPTFDPATGCPGHVVPDEAELEVRVPG